MAKGPARELGTDLLAVQETAADKGGRGDLLMKSSHRKSYVWLCRAGGRGVIGFKLEELNRLIDEWNNHPCPLLDFWEWLSLTENDCIKGFDVIWNQGNPLMSYVHIIKKRNVNYVLDYSPCQMFPDHKGGFYIIKE